ncbi:MAG: hypothetical protein Q9180_008646 [Flavoplaca navasiana]
MFGAEFLATLQDEMAQMEKRNFKLPLDAFPQEIKTHIISYLSLDIRGLKNVRLVSHNLAETAAPFLFGELRITPSILGRFKDLRSRQAVQRHVRTLDICFATFSLVLGKDWMAETEPSCNTWPPFKTRTQVYQLYGQSFGPYYAGVLDRNTDFLANVLLSTQRLKKLRIDGIYTWIVSLQLLLSEHCKTLEILDLDQITLLNDGLPPYHGTLSVIIQSLASHLQIDQLFVDGEFGEGRSSCWGYQYCGISMRWQELSPYTWSLDRIEAQNLNEFCVRLSELQNGIPCVNTSKTTIGIRAVRKT